LSSFNYNTTAFPIYHVFKNEKAHYFVSGLGWSICWRLIVDPEFELCIGAGWAELAAVFFDNSFGSYIFGIACNKD